MKPQQVPEHEYLAREEIAILWTAIAAVRRRRGEESGAADAEAKANTYRDALKRYVPIATRG